LIQIHDLFILWNGITRVWIGGQAKLQAFIRNTAKVTLCL